MKAIVIGAGMSGLTAAVTLARAGWTVEVFEQSAVPGGVTAGWEKDGFRWDLGQLMIEGLGRDEPVGAVMSELGVLDKLEVSVEDRAYVFPDFSIDKPATYGGVRWRMDALELLFPEETPGLRRYWRDSVRFTRVMTRARRMDNSRGVTAIIARAGLLSALLPLLPKKDWSADRLAAHYFTSERLKAVFVSILADFFTPPRRFPGLGLFAINPETAFEKRMSPRVGRGAFQIRQYFVRGGMRSWVAVMVERLEAHGGVIHCSSAVTRILVSGTRATGVQDESGTVHTADVIVASGGAEETFAGLVGEQHLQPDFRENLRSLSLMESIFMIHLGVDYDPGEHLKSLSTYFYGSYDVDGEIDRARRGEYHEGAGGFVVHFPTSVFPDMAPAGHHGLTIYTICPDRLCDGSWEALKEGYADRLLAHAEKRLPGLRQHIVTRHILTPDDFRAIAHVKRHAFGGLAPVMGAWRPPYRAPIEGLWFVGAQSESGGGVNNVVAGAFRVARDLTQTRGNGA